MGDKQSKQKATQDSQPVKEKEKLPSSSVDGPSSTNDQNKKLESNGQLHTTDTSPGVGALNGDLQKRAETVSHGSSDTSLPVGGDGDPQKHSEGVSHRSSDTSLPVGDDSEPPKHAEGMSRSSSDTGLQIGADGEPQKHKEDLSHGSSDVIHTASPQSSADTENGDHLFVFENHFSADDGIKTKIDSSKTTQDASSSESMFSSLPVNLGQETSKEALKITSSLNDRGTNKLQIESTTDFVQKEEEFFSESQPTQRNIVHTPLTDRKLEPDIRKSDSDDQDVERSQKNAMAENLPSTLSTNDTEQNTQKEVAENGSIFSPQKPLSDVTANVMERQNSSHLPSSDVTANVTERQNSSHLQKQSNDDEESKGTSLKEPTDLTMATGSQKQVLQLHVQTEPIKQNMFIKRSTVLEQSQESVIDGNAIIPVRTNKKEQPLDAEFQTDEKTSDEDFYQNIPSERQTNQNNSSDCQTNQDILSECQTNQNISSECQTNQNISSDRQTNKDILFERQTNQNIPSDRQTHQNILSERRTNQNIPSERQINQNIPPERQTNQNIPSERQTSQNIPSERQINQNIPSKIQTNIPNRSWNLGKQKSRTFERSLSQTSSITPQPQNITFPMKTVSVETETSTKIAVSTQIKLPPTSTSDSKKDIKGKGDNSARPEAIRKQATMVPVSNLSSSFQMVHKEFRSVCAYIKELQLSNRSILKKLTEEKSQYEKACVESDKRVADLDHCVVCLEQRIKQREIQIRQMTQLVQHLLQKVNELGEALECMPETTSDEEEEEEADSDVEDSHREIKERPHISKHEDGFRRQSVLHEADNRQNFKIEGMPKSRHLRRLAAAKSAEKAKLAFAGLPGKDSTATKHGEKSYDPRRSSKSRSSKGNQRNPDEANIRTLRSHGAESGALSTGKTKSKRTGKTEETKVDKREVKSAKRENKGGQQENQKTKEQRKTEETNIPNVQKRPTDTRKGNQTFSGTPIRNEFRNALTSATDITEGRRGNRGLALDLNSWISLANLKMHEGVGSIPRGNGPDTVLCLDVSESMAGEPFNKMITLANQFVDGLREVHMTLGIEQNVALVTFGHTTTVVQHLTNDFRVVKEQISSLSAGGPSPLVAGLLMCIAAAVGNGGPCILGGSKIHANIIIMTDGQATALSRDTDPDPGEADPMSDWEVHSSLTAVIHDIKNRKFTISYIALGNFNPSHMKGAAAITGGKEIKPDHLQQVYKRPKNLVLGSELRKHLQNSGMDFKDLELVKSAVRGLCSEDVTSTDVDDIAEIICHPSSGNLEKEEDSEDIQDKLGLRHREIRNSNMPPIGTRMRRGPDWSWGSQDSNGPGTVVSHKADGWIWIVWDSGHRNQYCYGANEKYDVIIVDEPRILQKDQLIEVGCLVKRGPDWKDGEVDGGPGNVGVVFRVHENATVGVRWPNAKLCNHKFSCDGKFEVLLCDPSEHAARMLDETLSAAASGGQSSLDDKERDDPDMDKKLEEMNKRNRNNTQPKSVQKDTKSELKQNTLTRQSVNTPSHRNKKPQDEESVTKDRAQSSQKLNVPQNLPLSATNIIQQNTEKDQPRVQSEEVEWQFKDEYGGWTCFSDENSRKIEKTYAKNPLGLTVVTVAKSNHRILLKQMIMVNTTTKAVTDIRRKST